MKSNMEQPDTSENGKAKIIMEFIGHALG